MHLAEALAKGLPPPGTLAVPIFTHGSLDVEMYAGLDLTVYALVLLSLLAAVALAVCGPALRAMQTDPITALRSE